MPDSFQGDWIRLQTNSPCQRVMRRHRDLAIAPQWDVDRLHLTRLRTEERRLFRKLGSSTGTWKELGIFLQAPCGPDSPNFSEKLVRVDVSLLTLLRVFPLRFSNFSPSFYLLLLLCCQLFRSWISRAILSPQRRNSRDAYNLPRRCFRTKLRERLLCEPCNKWSNKAFSELPYKLAAWTAPFPSLFSLIHGLHRKRSYPPRISLARFLQKINVTAFLSAESVQVQFVASINRSSIIRVLHRSRLSISLIVRRKCHTRYNRFLSHLVSSWSIDDGFWTYEEYGQRTG